MRKLFIVTVNIPSFQVWWRQLRGKDPDGYPAGGHAGNRAVPSGGM